MAYDNLDSMGSVGDLGGTLGNGLFNSYAVQGIITQFGIVILVALILFGLGWLALKSIRR
jgi:hypothetical protein